MKEIVNDSAIANSVTATETAKDESTVNAVEKIDYMNVTWEWKVCTIKKPGNPNSFLTSLVASELFALYVIPAVFP